LGFFFYKNIKRQTMNESDTYKSYLKRTVYVGGLAEEVDEKVLRSAFIPFGDIVDVQVTIVFRYYL